MQRTGGQADLASWHRTVDPVNAFGLVMINSSGGPDRFQIDGGVGRPSDIPGGAPAAVAMIHSFSAADPTDPQTIAGRWLAQGAFNYFGRDSRAVPACVPWIPWPGRRADRRRGPPGRRIFGKASPRLLGSWRLCYLGDPLYRLQDAAITPGDRPVPQSREPTRERRPHRPRRRRQIADVRKLAGRRNLVSAAARVCLRF